jgi:hypothetical protein
MPVRDAEASSKIFKLLSQLGSSMSGSRYDPRNIRRLGMSPRQQELNWLLAWYNGVQYDTQTVDWDGTPHLTPAAQEAVTAGNFMAPGFTDNSRSDETPFKLRRPMCEYHLPRRVIDTFTAHLFGEGMHPRVQVLGDDPLEDYIAGVLEASRFWAVMSEARSQGGAMGACCLSFKILEGEPVIDYHDPRWTTPTFKDRERLILSSIEERFIFPVEIEKKPGEFVTVPFWHRRILDEQKDTYFEPAPVDEKGREPEWEIKEQVEHGYGFFPGVWIINLPPPQPGDIYGETDIGPQSTYNMARRIDELQSASIDGTLYNCDPTLILKSDNKIPAKLKKGSRNAIKFEKDPTGDARYLETALEGPKTAAEMAKQLRGQFLEVTACVLDQDQAAAGEKTATEIRKRYAPMWKKLGTLRERWGEYGVKRLINIMIKVIRLVESTEKTDPETGEAYLPQIILPPKVDRISADETNVEDRVLPPDTERPPYIKLEWPPLDETSVEEGSMVVTMATTALGAGGGPQVTTLEKAVRKCARYFDDEDPQRTLEEIEEKMAEAEAKAQEQQDEQDAAGAAPPDIDDEALEDEEEPEDEDDDLDFEE